MLEAGMEMTEPKRILFPVDYSAACRAAAGSVKLWARTFGAEVTLLNASEGAADEARLRAFALAAFSGFPVQELLVQAKPAEAILERRPDLIMMPTRGESSFQARVMGSVTMAVLHDAECPVWTTAHAEDAPSERCRRILCALDLSAHSIDTLRWLAMVKDRFGAEARVVHCVPSVASRFDSGAAERAHHFLVWNARDKYPAMAAEAGVSEAIEIVESPGAVAESITAEARRYGADLLIAGRGAVRGVLGRLRSNAQELIHTSPCPVLSV